MAKILGVLNYVSDGETKTGKPKRSILVEGVWVSVPVEMALPQIGSEVAVVYQASEYRDDAGKRHTSLNGRSVTERA